MYARLEDVLHPGSLISHYRIEKMIGEGGMGRVYLARDPTLGRNVAVKLLNR
jgi:serine/threonine-protein kinase